MLPRVKIILREDKKNAKGLIPLYIESYYKGQRIQKSTSIFIKKDQWNGREITDHPYQARLNKQLRKKIADIEQGYSEAALHGEVHLKEQSKEATLPFVTFARHMINRQRGKVEKSTTDKYEIKINIIEKWDSETPISKIDYDWLEKLEQHLRQDKGDNTVWDYFKLVKKVVLNAYRKGLLRKNPFEEYEMPKYSSPIPTYLTKDELDKIKQYLLELEDPKDIKVTAFFLVECFSGLRHSDWHRFEVERLTSGEAIKVAANKNGEPVYLYLDSSPPLKWIVDYIRDNNVIYDLSLSTTNRELKAMAKACKIRKTLSTHVGRHTFGTLSAELGITVDMIAEFLAISRKVAEVYVTITRQKSKREFELWKNY